MTFNKNYLPYIAPAILITIIITSFSTPYSTIGTPKTTQSKKIMRSEQTMTRKPSHQKLDFLYTNTFGKTIRKALSKKWFSDLSGWYADSFLSRQHIETFVKTHNIDMNEALRPIQDYKSFNDFFTRKLKPDARPLGAAPIISPADGALTIIRNIQSETPFTIKNARFSLKEMLKSSTRAHRFVNGTMLIIRLAPWDYHRFHLPFDATISRPTRINGIYESVDPRAYAAGIQPLTTNERQYIDLVSPDGHNALFVAVGAMCVGKIIFTHTPQKEYSKGTDIGYFAFGGSTIVLLFEQDFVLDESLVTSFLQDPHEEIPLKMGQPLGSWIDHAQGGR